MVIQVSHLEKLFKESDINQLKLDLTDRTSANTLKMAGDNINFQDFVDENYIGFLREKNVHKVSVCIEKDALAQLRKIFPEDYEPAQYEETADKILEKLKVLTEVNRYSKRIRELILMQEVIETLPDAKKSKRIMFRQGAGITDTMLKKIQAKFGATYKIQYSLNETGILVFVNDPGKNISMKIDILAVFAKSRIPVFVGDTEEEAYEIFMSKKPKLLLLTYLDQSWESKDLFLKCAEQDPFFKFINYAKSPSANRDQEFSKIMLTYNGDYKAALEMYKKSKADSKPTLESKMRNPIMDRLEHLRNNYNGQHYVEMKYYLFRLGFKYNVRTIDIILDKIKAENQA